MHFFGNIFFKLIFGFFFIIVFICASFSGFFKISSSKITFEFLFLPLTINFPQLLTILIFPQYWIYLMKLNKCHVKLNLFHSSY